MIQVNRIYLIFNRLVTKKFLVDTSDNDWSIIHTSIIDHDDFYILVGLGHSTLKASL